METLDPIVNLVDMWMVLEKVKAVEKKDGETLALAVEEKVC